MSLCGLYMIFFFQSKIAFSYHIFVGKILCVIVSLICLEYYDFLYASILPYMFALSLFL
jgi:hypothetical protein